MDGKNIFNFLKNRYITLREEVTIYWDSLGGGWWSVLLLSKTRIAVVVSRCLIIWSILYLVICLSGSSHFIGAAM